MSDEKFYRIPQPIHPFVNPLPTPATSPNDPESQICVMFSRNWLPFVLGVIKLFQYDDLWENPTEQLKNDGQTLIRQFMTPFLCETGASNVDIQAVDLGGGCQQYQWRIDGGVWMDIGVPVCSGQDGAPGEQGIPGEPGAPGEDCDCGTVPPQPPVVEGDDRCQQACNIAMGLGLYLKQTFDDSLAVTKQALQATGIIADAVSDLIDAIPVIGAVVNTIVDYATGLGQLDISALQSASSNAFREQIQCELYRIMADDTGDFTLEYFEQVKDELQTWGLLLPPQGPLLVIIGQSFAAFLLTMPTAEFLRRANVYKDSDSNCELCEVECGEIGWDICWNESTGWGNWSIAVGSESAGTVVTGFHSGVNPVIGGYNSYRNINVGIGFGITAHITNIKIVFDYTFGEENTGGDSSFYLVMGSVGLGQTILSNIVFPALPSSPFEWSGSLDKDALYLIITSAAVHDSVPNDGGGEVVLREIRISGTGTKPDIEALGAMDCE